MKMATIKLSDLFHSEVKTYCKSKGYTFSGLVKRLVTEEMERDPISQ